MENSIFQWMSAKSDVVDCAAAVAVVAVAVTWFPRQNMRATAATMVNVEAC